MTFLRQFDPRC